MRIFSLLLAGVVLAACARATGSPPLPEAMPNGSSLTPEAVTQCAQAASAFAPPNLNYVSPKVWVPLSFGTWCTETNLKAKNYNLKETDFRSQTILHASVYRLAEWSDPLHDYYLVVTSTMSAPYFECGKKFSTTVRNPFVYSCGQVVDYRDTTIENLSGQTIREYSPRTVNKGVENTFTIGGGLGVSAGGVNANGNIGYSESWEQGAVETTVDANNRRVSWHDTFTKPKEWCHCFEVDVTANNTYETQHAAIVETSEGTPFSLSLRANTNYIYYATWDCMPCKSLFDIKRPAQAGANVNIRPPSFDVQPKTIDVHLEGRGLFLGTALKITAENPNSGLLLGWRAIKTPNQVAILSQSEGLGTTTIRVVAPNDPSLIGRTDFLRFTSVPDCATNSLEKSCDQAKGNGGLSVEVHYVK